jgi:succinyl-CoA synthetase beta subunit
MKIHEYQAKELFRKYDINVPEGRVISDPAQAGAAATELDSLPLVVKAQIHAGGRGKGGGVKVCATIAEVEDAARAILGMTLVTRQTGSQGRVVKKILIEKGLTIRRELYLALLVDRENAGIMIMASSAGGVNIEETAAQTPGKIIKIKINPLAGIQAYHCRQAAFALNLTGSVFKQFTAMLPRLYRLFIERDCSLLEINPLVITEDEQLPALDAKLDIDQNSLFRHPDLTAFYDENEVDPLEAEAAKYKLNYINLGGTVGNMVNGAGLAMATMDIIKQAGAEPANFLDVGGGASAEMVENGFRLILADKNVRGILINIFGGILRCDVLAQGVVRAAEKTGVRVPVVVRMEGTNAEQGRRILADSGLNLITAENMKEAALRIAEI